MTLDLNPLRHFLTSLESALEGVGDESWFGRQPARVQNTRMAGLIQKLELVYEGTLRFSRDAGDLLDQPLPLAIHAAPVRPGWSIPGGAALAASPMRDCRGSGIELRSARRAAASTSSHPGARSAGPPADPPVAETREVP